MIRYLKHKNINKIQWDNCIEKSFNRTVYAYSWYLDILSPGWDALVEDDYVSVMPLTHRKKYGIPYICQPILCQQLGVFSTKYSDAFTVDDYINLIPAKFKLIEVAFNTKNIITCLPKHGTLNEGINYELAINKPYTELSANYDNNHIKNIRKVAAHNLTIETGTNLLKVFLEYKTNAVSSKKIKFTKRDQELYCNLLFAFKKNNSIKVYIVRNESNDVVGGICFFFVGNKVMFQSFTNDLGKKLSIGYYLIDQFIKEHAGQNLILDFMGSTIKSIAYRNEGFGSTKTLYTQVKITRFTTVIRFLIMIWDKLKTSAKA